MKPIFSLDPHDFHFTNFRLHHLENVLEEMRQREGHFMRLAEETSALKDQVDALRELSMMSLKGDNKGSGNSLAGW